MKKLKKFYNDGVHTKAEVDRLLEEMEKVHQKNVDDIINKAREEREKERLKGLESVKKTLDDYDKYIEQKQKDANEEALKAEKDKAKQLERVKKRKLGVFCTSRKSIFPNARRCFAKAFKKPRTCN